MARLSPQERQLQEMNRLGRLGAPTGETVALTVPPFKFFIGGWLIILLGVASIAGAVLMAVVGREPVGGVFFCLLGLFFVIGGFFMHRQREVSRGVLELHAQGFVHARGNRRRAVAFEEIRSLSLTETEELRNGTRAGWRRQLTIEDDSGKVTLRQLALTGQADGFGGFLNRVLEQSATAATARIKTGTPLRGKGWTLDGGGLVFAGGSEGRPLAYTEISAVDQFEGKIALWRRGEENPCFAVPSGTPNARLLWTIIARNLPAAGTERTDPDSLGRLLFQKKASRASVIIFALVGLGVAAGGVIALLDKDPGNHLAGAICLPLGLLIAVFTLHLGATHFRVHEKGLARRTLFGARRLRYGEIAAFTYSATRMYHNGVYTGTQIQMSFRPEQGKPLSLGAHTRGSDEDLERLRDQLAEQVAGRMYQQVKTAGSAAWGKTVTLTREGVRYRTAKLFGKGEEKFIPFSAGVRYAITSGTLHLYAGQEKKPAHSLPCSGENFFPGFTLLGRLATEAAAPRGV
jgi:hypothetical protein